MSLDLNGFRVGRGHRGQEVIVIVSAGRGPWAAGSTGLEGQDMEMIYFYGI